LRVTRAARCNARKAALLAAVFLASPGLFASSTTRSRSRTTNTVAQPSSLKAALEQAALRPPAKKDGVSIAVADLETGETIFEKNARAPETIASVTKMISTAAALHYLGPAYKFRTTFWRRGEIRDGNLLGSLLVVGGGDPNISGRFYDDDVFAIFDKWAAGLRQAGILRVTGDLVLNASIFDEEYRHPDWPPSRDSHWYQAPVSGLSYNDNVVVVSVGRGALPGAPASVTIDPNTDVVQTLTRARTVGKAGKIRVAVSRPSGSDVVTVSGTVPNRYFRWAVPLSIDDPPKFFGAALKSRLKAAGVELTGSVVERPMPADNAWILVATTESDIIPTLAIANKRSQSFYAEQIFKTLAYEKSGRGTWESALSLAGEFLEGLGLEAKRFSLRDGSGLSSGNRVSASDLVQFLQAMNRHPQGPVWRSTLAISGDPEGSLRHRLNDSPYRGLVSAKTGTLNGVSTLAGYAQAPSGKTYAFAILLNGPRVTESRGHAYQDRLLKVLLQRG
jgi:D-alanyl-D-alanine carboxypeptidase/D-alanyl-D-alanine-endopeptidase (penicillin-binding protein 4)